MATESIYNNVYINDPEKAEKMIATLEKAKSKAKHLSNTSIKYIFLSLTR